MLFRSHLLRRTLSLGVENDESVRHDVLAGRLYSRTVGSHPMLTSGVVHDHKIRRYVAETHGILFHASSHEWKGHVYTREIVKRRSARHCVGKHRD